MMTKITRLLDFPDEVLCVIWEFLGPFDALYSFLHLNHRFDRLLLPFKQQIDLTNLSYGQFMYYINTLLPVLNKDGSLNVMKLGNKRTPGQIKLFNTLISNEHHRTYFNNIERILLESPRLVELIEFVDDFLLSLPNLVALSIQIDHIRDEDFRRLTQLIINSIFSITTLVKLSIEMSSSGLVLSHLANTTMFHSLVYVNLSLSLVTDLLILIQRIPNVENLSISLSWWTSGDRTIIKMLDEMRSNEHRRSLLNKLKKFRLIIHSIITFQFEHFEQLLDRILNNQLTYSFTLILHNGVSHHDEIMKLIDGEQWKRLLGLYSSLTQFDLCIRLNGHMTNDEELRKLSSFNSNYFRERKWFFSYFKYSIGNTSVFYSIPYRNQESFHMLINNEILSKYFPVNYTPSLSIDLANNTDYQSIFDFLFKHFPSIQELTLYHMNTSLPVMNSLNIPSLYTVKIAEHINLFNLLRLFPLINTLSVSSFNVLLKTVYQYNQIIELSINNISKENLNQILVFLNQFPSLRFLHLHIQNRRISNEILLANLNEIIQIFPSLIQLKIQLENDIESSISENNPINFRMKMRFTDVIFDGVLMHLWF